MLANCVRSGRTVCPVFTVAFAGIAALLLNVFFETEYRATAFGLLENMRARHYICASEQSSLRCTFQSRHSGFPGIYYSSQSCICAVCVYVRQQ